MDPMAAMGMGGYGMPGMPGMGGYGAAAVKAPAGGKGVKEMRAGDWSCPKCFDINYATRSVCRLCNTPKAMAGKQGGESNKYLEYSIQTETNSYLKTFF